MSNRQATYTLNLNNNVIRSLEQTEAAALRVDGVMGELNRTMSMFGLAFGAGFVINIGKEWVQTAADYEQSMMRIKNASENAMEGLKNQFFIKDVIDRFKIDLESGLDAYGHFLFKIKNAKLGRDKENKLFEELTAVGKVSGLSESEVNSTIRNMSIMLGEGILEARHLRALSYSHPQVIPFIADAMGLKDFKNTEVSKSVFGKKSDVTGETKLQQISQMISSGKLTKAALDAKILLDAMDLYYDSIKDKIPSTLSLVQSEINSLGSAWTNFKQSLVLGDKPELTEFIHELTGGIKYLAAHSGEISKLAGDIGNLIKLYAGWRIGIMALQLPFGIMSFFRNETTRLTSTFGLYIPKVHEAAIANERLAATQTQLIVENEAYVETQTLATEADIRRVLGITELNIAIEQSTAAQAIQMEMFTESTVGRVGGEYELNLKLRELEQERIAQSEFANSELIAIEEAFIAKKEAILLADRHKFGYNVFQQKSQYNAEVVALNEQMIIDQQRVKAELIYIETEYQAKVAELRQAGFVQQQEISVSQISLFTEVETVNIELANKIALANTEAASIVKAAWIEAGATEEAAFAAASVAGISAGERIRIENTYIADSAKIAADAAAAAWAASAAEAEAAWIACSAGIASLPINTGAAGIAKGIIPNAIGLAGKTRSLLSSAIMPVFIAGMATEVGLMFLDKGKISGESVGIKEYLGDMLLLQGNARRIDEENERTQQLAKELDKLTFELGYSNFKNNKGIITPRISAEGHELYNLLAKYPDFLDKLDPKNKFGNRLTENIELFDIIKRVFPGLLLLIENPSVVKPDKDNDDKASKAAKELNKGSAKLKGNSVTNIHISWTGGMNGMTNPKFVVNNMADMEDIEEKVGSILVKKLTDAVNDAQYLH